MAVCGVDRTVSITDTNGHFALSWPGCGGPVTLRASAPGLESDAIQIASKATAAPMVLSLHPTSVRQHITVTATRAAIDLPATAGTAYALSGAELKNVPSTALDDKLRQHAGFELFRRASSTIANPTSQGVSLRGLGSTAASRTLVLEDGVPWNDPFGGWIHWDAIPQYAIDSVDLATGGGSDLYGSSALGGVIDIVPSMPSRGRFDASAFGGGDATAFLSLRGDVGSARWRQLVAGDSFQSAGYVPTSPSVAGPVDVPANLHDGALRTETDRVQDGGERTFLVGNLLTESRSNGTRLQTNGTRLWRYVAGEDWSSPNGASGRARLFGSNEAYRQSFSSVTSARTAESLTRLQQVRTQEVGASGDASFAGSRGAIVTGLDLRDIRATDTETPIAAGGPAGIADTSARQRFLGGFGEVIASREHWSLAASLRVDRTWNLDTRSITQPAVVAQPVATADRREFIASPRIGIVRAFGPRASVHTSAFRAFRTPTMNELYRTGQVGQQTTQANPQLLSERATGWDAGGSYGSYGDTVRVQATCFWTEINRPVSAVIVSTSATSILERRQNLGQIVSRGAELLVDVHPSGTLSGSIGYSYAHAVVTRFSAQPQLVNHWIAQVPRQSVTAHLRAQNARLGAVTLAARAAGRAYDDSANTYVLRGFFLLDLLVRHDFGAQWTGSFSAQNLLNRRPDVARTPILTLGSPLLVQGGLEFHWSRMPTR
ncbi:MAG: TonB-dependent receptor [Acidobacteriota bacterium]|nr:TonB-dependent receptor [Acidobacteriota bacterium]